MAVIMLRGGRGFARSILIIHIFSTPSQVQIEVSAKIQAPNCTSIFKDTGLDILEQQYFHPPTWPLTKQCHQKAKENPRFAYSGSITPKRPQIASPLSKFLKLTLDQSYLPALPNLLNNSRSEGMEEADRQSSISYCKLTPMTFLFNSRTQDHLVPMAGNILALMIGYMSSYLGLQFFHISFNKRKLLVSTSADAQICLSVSSTMAICSVILLNQC